MDLLLVLKFTSKLTQQCECINITLPVAADLWSELQLTVEWFWPSMYYSYLNDIEKSSQPPFLPHLLLFLAVLLLMVVSFHLKTLLTPTVVKPYNHSARALSSCSFQASVPLSSFFLLLYVPLSTASGSMLLLLLLVVDCSVISFSGQGLRLDLPKKY